MSELTAAAIDRITDLVREGGVPAATHLSDRRYAFRLRDSGGAERLEVVDVADTFDRPERRAGQVTVSDVFSLVAYVNRYRDEDETTLWGDRGAARIVAVLNDHPAGQPAFSDSAAAWGDHRATLQLQYDPDFSAWLGSDGKWYDQEGFASFLEQLASTVGDAATMYEIATSLRATKGVDFKQALNVSSGEVKLRYEETTSAKAGQKGELDIPTVFQITVPVYEGAEPTILVARFLYRIQGTELRLGYRLLRPSDAIRSAFVHVATQVQDGLKLPLLMGSPRR